MHESSFLTYKRGKIILNEMDFHAGRMTRSLYRRYYLYIPMISPSFYPIATIQSWIYTIIYIKCSYATISQRIIY